MPTELYQQLEARIGTDGKNISEVIKTLLQSSLSDSFNNVEQSQTTVEQRLTVVEQRLTALEQGLTTPPTPKSQPAPSQQQPETRSQASEGTAAAKHARTAQNSSEGDYVRADGRRWLTTSDAYNLAQLRGYEGTFNAFRSWAKRNPEKMRLRFRLAPTGYTGRANTAASYEDLDKSPTEQG